MISTADGKIYLQIICFCGRQNSAGICEHVRNPVYVEQLPPQNGFLETGRYLEELNDNG